MSSVPVPIPTHRITISETELASVLTLLDAGSTVLTGDLISFRKKLLTLHAKINAGVSSPVYVKSNVDRKTVSMEKLGFNLNDVESNEFDVSPTASTSTSLKSDPTDDDFAAAEAELAEQFKILTSNKE